MIRINSSNNFQVVSFSANAEKCAPGQPISVTAKIKNVSGAAISMWRAGLGVNERQFTNSGYMTSYLTYTVGGENWFEEISWKAGVSKTFTWTVTLGKGLSEPFITHGTRAVLLMLCLRTQNSAMDYYTSDVVILNKFFNPDVEQIDFIRATDKKPHNEGESLLTTLKLAMVEPEDGYVFEPSCTLTYWEKGSPDDKTELSLTDKIPALVSGVVRDSDILSGTFLKNSGYWFELEFGDDYESVRVKDDVSVAFGNFILSETGKGASFGRFPSSTKENPLLESDYPVVPYNGIAGVNIYMPGVILHDFNETAGTWIENGTASPIHRATITFGAMAKDAEQQIDIGIPGSKVERIVSVDGMFDAGDGAWMSLMYSNDAGVGYHVRTAVINVGTAGSNLKLRLITGASRTIERGHATISYIPVKGE